MCKHDVIRKNMYDSKLYYINVNPNLIINLFIIYVRFLLNKINMIGNYQITESYWNIFTLLLQKKTNKFFVFLDN